MSDAEKPLPGTAETIRESHPIPGPVFPVTVDKPVENSLEWHLAQAVAAEGLATRKRRRLHLTAMIAGANAHPDLRWSQGEQMTAAQFAAGIKKIEDHKPAAYGKSVRIKITGQGVSHE